jgi:dynein heavy chain
MNKINFDQIVSSKPGTFSYVTLPMKEEEKVPEHGESCWTRGYPPG